MTIIAHTRGNIYTVISWSDFPSNSNGKEKDYESGFHYYGARYYWSEVLTGWLSVDPMMDKYPGISPYAYCAWNPINAMDPNGMDSIHTPNGMANVGEGYKATPDGMYLYGDGLQTKKWNPNLQVGCVAGGGQCGGYEDCDASELPKFYGAEKTNLAGVPLPTAFSMGLVLEQITLSIGTAMSTAVSYILMIPAFALFSGDTRKCATDNGNNEKHGDKGRAKAKADKQVKQLEIKLNGASRKERKELENKIKNIKRNAEKKNKGVEHSRANKR